MKKISLLFMVILFLGCQTMPKDPALMDPEAGMDLLIKSFGAAQEMKGKNIGVGDFVGTSGKVHILYPNRFSGAGKVLAGKTYSLPGRNDGYLIMVEGFPGIEVVRAIATLTPVPATEVDFSKFSGLFKEVDQPAVLARDLNIVAKQTSPSSRGEELIRIEIRE